MSKFTEGVVSEIKKNYIQNLAAAGLRIDNRGLEEYRNIEVIRNFVTRANGSALVKIGNTQVLAGIKIEPGEPFPDTPNVGVITTNAELVPLASPTFESGPPGEDAIELARVVDRGLRESKTIDLEKLVIKENELVWIIFIDIHVLDYDGNLFDASSLASMIALTEAVVPASKYGYGEDFKLPVNHYPVEITAVKIDNSILIDPNLDEENISSARLTVASNELGNVNAMQKGSTGSFSIEEIKKIINTTIKIGNEIREKYILKKGE